MEYEESDDEYEESDDEEESDDQDSAGDNSVEKENEEVLSEGIMADGCDTDDEDVEEKFQKFESNADYIRDVHPEILGINHEEIETMSRVIYNQNGIIEDPLHTGTPILTKYELARVLGARAAQIDNGSPPFVVIDSMDGYTIAKEELKQKKIPFIIRRPMPNGKFEIWKLESLENIY